MLPIDRWPPPPGDGPEEEEEVLEGEESLEEPFLDEPGVPVRGSTPLPPLPVVPALVLSLLPLDEGP